ncbi:phage scaffolding protein [Massilimicrobiota timonensis]|nr:phage scaffolding protein [Massilimicrobiota timonensis]
MKKEKLIELGLDEETAKKVEKESENELTDYVPRAQFDIVVKERDAANETIKERDGQLEKLKGVNVEELQNQITNLQNENKQKDEDYAKEIKQLRVNNAIESELTKNGALNMKAVKALLDVDIDKINVKEDGTLEGLNIDEQIKTLKEAEDSKFMFKEEKKKFKGANPSKSTGKKGNDDGVDLSKMTYEEIAKYLEENPDVEL